jgi:hypothetical protein
MGVWNVLHVGHTGIEVFDDALVVAREEHLTIRTPRHGPDRVLVSRHKLLKFKCVALRGEEEKIKHEYSQRSHHLPEVKLSELSSEHQSSPI